MSMPRVPPKRSVTAPIATRRRRQVGESTYVYDYSRPGHTHVERTKNLARTGSGLGTYISQHVRDAYAERLP
jgi:hypothetical protein